MSMGTSDQPSRTFGSSPPVTGRSSTVLAPFGAGSDVELSSLVERYGRTSVSPFIAEPGNVGLRVPEGVAAYRPVRRWAVFATGPAARVGFEPAALDAVLDHVAAEGRLPMFAAVPDPEQFLERGMWATEIADDALVALPGFSLEGKRLASIRHSVSAATRVGIRVVPYTSDLHAGLERVSQQWLLGKRGGELGFTLGTFDREHLARTECRVALDADGRVVGFVTWRRFDDGRGRVLDLMRRADDAPNPTMDLLVTSSLLEYSARGVAVASLGSVPRSHGTLGERFYATVSLRRYKEKFAPAWMPMWLAVPAPRRLPSALRALATAYCPGGMMRAVRPNG